MNVYALFLHSKMRMEEREGEGEGEEAVVGFSFMPFSVG
jgi:hypothetical protein